MKDLKTLPIVGIKFRPRETKALLTTFNPSTPITLEPEPDNKYDRFALKVMHNGTHCGYVPATHCQIFSVLIDNGIQLQARVFDVRNTDKGIEVDIIISMV